MQPTGDLLSSDLDLQISTVLETPTREETEVIRCMLDPDYYIFNYVITIDEDGIELPFPRYGYLEDLVGNIHDYNQLIVLKARQMLFTWTMAAYKSYKMNFFNNQNCLAISKDQPASNEVVRRAQFILENLPDWMCSPLKKPYSTKRIENGKNSRLLSLPCTPNVGRVFTAQIILCDEYAYQKYAKLVLRSCRPSLNKNGKLIIGSTPNPERIGVPFRQLCLKARTRGFVSMSLEYKMNPSKDKEWEKEERRSLTKQEFEYEHGLCLDKAGSGLIFEKEYDDAKHIIDPFPIPKEWSRYRVMDFGPHFCCLWLAQDPETKSLYVYRELYIRGVPTEQRCKMIKIRSKGENIVATVSDSADPQARRDMAKYGVSSIPCRKKDVLDSIWKVRLYLENDGTSEPGLFIFNTCIDLREDIEDYQGDENGYPLKHQGSHGVDCVRYIIVYLEDFKEGGYNDDDSNVGGEYEVDKEYGIIDEGVVSDGEYDEDDWSGFEEREIDL